MLNMQINDIFIEETFHQLPSQPPFVLTVQHYEQYYSTELANAQCELSRK